MARPRKRAFRAAIAVLAAGLCAGLYAGVARADVPPPSLASNATTYAPGDTVQLSGGNWIAGEPVHVHVADTGGNGWSFDDDLFAGADGSFADSLSLPSEFTSDFVAVATSGLGASATTSFSSTNSPPAPPVIVSDRNDYAPGSTVTLTGSLWQPGELVHIRVDDSDGHSWSYDGDVSADGSGGFTYQFQLPGSFIANYSVLATGFTGSTAQTAFTDAGSLSVNPVQGASGTSVSVGTGGQPFDDNRNDIGIYWDGTVGTTNGTLVATCSTNPSNGNINAPCTFNVPSSTAGAHTVVGTQQSNHSKSESATFTVIGPATQLAFTTQPTNTTVNNVIGGATGVKVAIQDVNGNTTSSTASVTIAIGTDPAAGTLSGTTTVNAVNGVATFSGLSIDQVGTGYTLAATSSGLTGATSNAFNIVKANTTTVTTCNPMTVAVDAPTTCTATVTDSATVKTVPTGTISWTTSVGGSTQFDSTTCTLSPTGNPGEASCQTTYTPDAASNRTVTGTYGGDSRHNGSNDPTGSITVNRRATTTIVSCTNFPVTASLLPSTCTVTLTDTSAGTQTAPAGTVSWSRSGGSGTFTPSSCTLGNVVAASSSCSVTYNPGSTSTATLTASYPQSTKHAASSGSAVTNRTTTNLSVSAASGTFGGTVNLSATLTSGSGAPVSGKTVSFTLRGTSVGTATTNSSGVAAVTGVSLAGIAVGSYPGAVAATFAGDSSFNSSTDSDTLTVNPNCVAVSISAGGNPSDQSITYGADATFTAAATGDPAPTVKWQVDSGSGFADMSPAQTNTTLTLTKPAVALSGNRYRAVFTNTCGGTQTATTSEATLTVSRKNLTITGAAANDKVYDGNALATVNFGGASLNGIVGSDSVSIDTSGYSASFANKSVGINKPVTVLGVGLSGTDAGNYTVSQPSGLTANISAKELSVSFQANNKTYDGTTNATIKSSPAPSLVGVVSGDTVVLDGTSASASFANKNVGTGKTVTASGFTKSGADAGNYVFASPQGTTTANISAKGLTITDAVANSKTYDGNDTATVDWTGASLNGVVSGDTVSIDRSGYSAHFNNKNVGTSKPVTVSGVTLGGVDAGNYTVSQPTGLTANISAKELSISLQANNKTYDGTTNAPIKSGPAPSLVGVVSGDTVVLDGTSASASFANKNVGTGKTVTASGFTKSGADAGNYVFASPQGTTTADISAKEVSVSFEAQNKEYDGTTAATIKASPAPSLVGVVSGDNVTLDGSSASASFANKNVGTGKTVTASGFTKGGTDAGNYVFATPQGTTTADISAKELSVSFQANNKTYDGTDNATIKASPTPSLVGKVTGDDVALGTGSAAAHFDSKNIGTGKAVTGSGFTKSGTDAGNYVFATPQGTTTADITKAPLDISAVGDTKVYDGSTSSSGVPTVGTGQLQGSDTVDGLMQAFQSKNVLGSWGSTLVVTGYTVHDGNAGGNYDITTHTAAGTITKAPLDINATSDSKTYDGTTSSSGTPTHSASQLKADDTVDGLTQAFQSKNVLGTGNSTLEVSAYTVNDGNSGGNYDVTTHTASGTITRASLDIYAVTDTKVYDGTTSSTGTPTVSGLQGSDTVTGKAQRFQSKNVLGTGNSTLEVSAYTVNDGNSGGNYNVTPHTASGTITKKNLTVSGITANNKPWDGNTSATLNVGGASLVGVVSGDTVTLNTGAAVGTFGSAAVGSQTVMISGLTISGADTGNYNLIQPTTTASIGAWNADGYGFYAPVGVTNSIFTAAPAQAPTSNPGEAWNTAKGGSTIPLKFNVFASTVEKTNLQDISGFQTFRLNACSGGAGEDQVDFVGSGNTSLRYDTSAMQWIQNWKTPTNGSDTCYRTIVTFADGSSIEAFFKLRR